MRILLPADEQELPLATWSVSCCGSRARACQGQQRRGWPTLTSYWLSVAAIMHMSEAKGWKGWLLWCTQTVRHFTLAGENDASLRIMGICGFMSFVDRYL